MNRNVALIFSEPEEEAEGLKRSNKGKGGSLSSPFMSVESLNTSLHHWQFRKLKSTWLSPGMTAEGS